MWHPGVKSVAVGGPFKKLPGHGWASGKLLRAIDLLMWVDYKLLGDCPFSFEMLGGIPAVIQAWQQNPQTEQAWPLYVEKQPYYLVITGDSRSFKPLDT